MRASKRTASPGVAAPKIFAPRSAVNFSPGNGGMRGSLCATVPASWAVAEHGRRLAASIRAAGFVPLRLDLAQDSGFAAAAIPLGVGLPDRRGRR